MKKAALWTRGGLNGYRTGAAKDGGRPPVGFNKAEMRGAAAELDMSAYGFSVHAEGGAGYGTLAARLDDLVSATSVSFDDASFERGVDVHPPPAAAAVTVGVQCETDLDGPAYG
ncbi:hypothetical protein CYMTET_37764 [Cymbomonas tetramitiformis]|uniref:Uncharacterized protein n=1 Tax=Cymbomonas tetramitiformis TaxID=36881 RepID=A0AAE0CDA3_9CHLO|nr:hypothetical protein CYMTET_37764 [Cymbomonas tetramitiformis]